LQPVALIAGPSSTSKCDNATLISTGVKDTSGVLTYLPCLAHSGIWERRAHPCVCMVC
jgi:hypothetical protein